jgi:predicted dehydrogenase
MDVFNRREFLNRAAILSAAAASAAGTAAVADDKPAAARVRSANDRLRIAVVGVHGRGMSHVGGFAGKNNCEITTVCDCDSAVIGNAMKTIESKQGKAPKFEQDIRRVVENKDVDVIAIATPNHWHALMAVWAMQNGKDTYVEKPASHNVHEGAVMLAVARKTNRICQVGTQSRSNPGMRDAIAYVQSGKLGKVDLAIGLCYKSRPSIGKVKEPTQPPASIDYDLWCGPAPKLPVMRAKLHYDWHWTYTYGNGDIGNQGVHEMDKARWGLGKKTLPNSVVSAGGRFGYVDDGETANTQLCLFDYGDSRLIFEVRGLKTDKYKGTTVGNIFVGTEGYVVCPDYGTGIVYDKAGKEIQKFSSGNDQHHFDNFVEAVRSRKAESLNCDISEGHLSAALCHLANISYRLGAETTFDKDIAGLSDSKEAGEFLARMKEHLTANGVDLSKAVGRAGPKLPIDPQAQKFTGNNAKANEMLTREYRKGFELEKA